MHLTILKSKLIQFLFLKNNSEKLIFAFVFKTNHLINFKSLHIHH